MPKYRIGFSALGYPVVLLFASALSLLKGIALAKILGPEDYGLYSKLLICLSYLVLTGSIGLHALAHKKFPAWLGEKGGQAKVDSYSYGAMLLLTGVTLLVVPVLVLVVVDRGSMPVAILGCALFAIAQGAFTLGQIRVKSDFRFFTYAVIAFFRAGIVIAVVVIAATYGAESQVVLLAESCALLAVVLIAFRLRLVSRCASAGMRGVFDAISTVKTHLRSASRLLLLSAVIILVSGADRFIGIVFLDDREFGLLAFGLIAIAAFEAAQVIVNVAVYPFLVRLVSANRDREAFNVVVLLTGVFTVFGILAWLIFSQWIPRFVNIYFPQYLDAVSVIAFYYFAGLLRFCDYSTTLSVVKDREASLIRRIGAVSGLIAVVGVVGLCEGHYVISIDTLGAYALTNAFGLWIASGWTAFESTRNKNRPQPA